MFTNQNTKQTKISYSILLYNTVFSPFSCLYPGFGGSLVPFLWPIILLRAKDFMVDRHLKSDDDKVFFRETLKSRIGFSSILTEKCV